MSNIILLLFIIATILGAFRGRKNGSFPKFPDVRDNTPLGPGGHREWPTRPVLNKPVQADRNVQTRRNERQNIEEGGTDFREIVHPTLVEPHETIHIKKKVNPAPDYQNPIRSDHVENGHLITHNEGRRSHALFNKNELVRAVVMAEILAPPRARNPRKLLKK